MCTSRNRGVRLVTEATLQFSHNLFLLSWARPSLSSLSIGLSLLLVSLAPRVGGHGNNK
jgi:hypothetical protein